MVFNGIGKTNVGRKRSQNEDTLVCDKEHGIFIVADGMGGENFGEVASRLTAEHFYSLILPFIQDEDLTLPFEQPAHGDSFLKALDHAIHGANRSVFEYSRQNKSYKGMGSTITTAVYHAGKLYVGHVGDSRFYKMDEKAIEQITVDHTKVQEMVEQQILTKEQARVHPQRNVITQCVGRKKRIRPDTFSIPLHSGSQYLLCSDGLTDMLSDEEIYQIVNQSTSFADTGEDLIEAANEKGGKDNITVVIFQVNEE